MIVLVVASLVPTISQALWNKPPALYGFGSTVQLLELDWHLQHEPLRLAVPYVSFIYISFRISYKVYLISYVF